MLSTPSPESYFSLVADRECGECMVCCEYLSINAPNLKKPADILCQHCVVNQGCKIYDSRPNVCRTWHCLWRRHPDMSDELRPDKSKVIFSLKISFEPRQVFENAYIVCMALTDPSVFDTPAVSRAIDMFVDEGSLPVWLSHASCKSLIWPRKDLADAITGSDTEHPAHVKEEGKIWLKRFNAMLEPLQDQQAMFGHEFLKN